MKPFFEFPVKEKEDLEKLRTNKKRKIEEEYNIIVNFMCK